MKNFRNGLIAAASLIGRSGEALRVPDLLNTPLIWLHAWDSIPREEAAVRCKPAVAMYGHTAYEQPRNGASTLHAKSDSLHADSVHLLRDVLAWRARERRFLRRAATRQRRLRRCGRLHCWRIFI